MPLYNFLCLDCGNKQGKELTFDEVASEDLVIVCDCCNGSNMQKIIKSDFPFPYLSTFNSLSQEEKKQVLKKRSHEHFKKNIEEKFNHINNIKN
jgi:hypothetical protein